MDADGAGGQAAVERIRADREHGASWLARAAAQALADFTAGDTAGDVATEAASQLAQTRRLARALAEARPSMAAIAMVAAQVWWAAASQPDADDATRLAAIRATAEGVIVRWDAAVEGMTAWARSHIAGPVYTLSRSGSVEGTLTQLARERAASSDSEPLRVIVAESRPGAEGAGLAQALARAGAQVTLAADAASAALMDQAELVIVGADSVRSDGAVVNKVGSRTLAVVAQAAGKPVYALAERLKITPPSYPLVIEEWTAEPPEKVAGLTLRNPVFDVTPAPLLSAIVTEAGPLSSAELARLAAQAERAWKALMAQ